MILVEITINSTLYRISMEGNDPDYEWTYNWKPYVISFDSPQYQLAKIWGGYCQLGFGAIELSHDLFASEWPPPILNDIVIKHTSTNDGSTETFFTGEAHLRSITRDSVVYDLHGKKYDIDLLAEDTDYNGDTVSLPRAFGSVTYVIPIRLADVGGNPTYHKGYIAGTKGIDWHVFDDGVDIDANVTDNGDGTFSLSATPIGQVSITGTGKYGTGVDDELASIMEWACGASYLNETFSDTYARVSQPSVAYWASSQRKILDFLSDLCAFFAHLFYVDSSGLHLIDMKLDNGSSTLTEFDYMPSVYEYSPPVSILKAKWREREAGEWRDPGGATAAAKYVKETKKTTSKTSSYAYGKEIRIEPYQAAESNITAALTDIESFIHKSRCRLSIPLTGSLPSPGKKLSWTDTALGQSTDMWIRARTIQYNFDDEEVNIEGEGVIAATP